MHTIERLSDVIGRARRMRISAHQLSVLAGLDHAARQRVHRWARDGAPSALRAFDEIVLKLETVVDNEERRLVRELAPGLITADEERP